MEPRHIDGRAVKEFNKLKKYMGFAEIGLTAP